MSGGASYFQMKVRPAPEASTYEAAITPLDEWCVKLTRAGRDRTGMRLDFGVGYTDDTGTKPIVILHMHRWCDVCKEEHSDVAALDFEEAATLADRMEQSLPMIDKEHDYLLDTVTTVSMAIRETMRRFKNDLPKIDLQ